VQKTIHTDEHEILTVLLRSARKDRALTQAELAQKLDVPQSFVSKVERGERILDVIEFGDYAAAVGTDPAKLYRHLWTASQKARGS
jgi:transcriptional regulator with XRE-family HTH domain